MVNIESFDCTPFDRLRAGRTGIEQGRAKWRGAGLYGRLPGEMAGIVAVEQAYGTHCDYGNYL